MPAPIRTIEEHKQLEETLAMVRKAAWLRALSPADRKWLEGARAKLEDMTATPPPAPEGPPNPEWESSELLFPKEVAELIGCHPATVYRRLEGDRLPADRRELGGEWAGFAWKIGNDWRIEKGPLLQHLAVNPIHSRQSGDDIDPMPKPADFQARLAEAGAV